MHRRTFVLLLAGLATVVALGCSKDKGSGELKSLTVDEVAAKLAAKDGKTFVFDDNMQESWAKAHVPTARWLDQDDVTAAVLPADKSALLIFYCHNES